MTTVAYPPVTATPTGRASRPVWRVLARAESCQLIRHPGFLAGCAAMLAILVLATVAGVDFSTLALSGFACLPLGVGTFIAANLTARRDARSGTEELLDPLPGPPAVRTAAQLAAVAAAPLVAVVAVAVTFIAVTALGGPEVRFTGGIRQRPPSFPELAQGPAGGGRPRPGGSCGWAARAPSRFHRQHAVTELAIRDLKEGRGWSMCRRAGSSPTPPGWPVQSWPTTSSAGRSPSAFPIPSSS